ncbi:MAG: IS21 family transposase [Sphaerochaeta sp.]|jgi:transposase|uniref:IS21 family transposase n=1 Tax=Sphaerochaeta sp. S2 TaxID=2798868 RepID=UPI0018E9EF75|nr:IS21 family transposase [Sphaerochaeta sp. S2]MBJ2355821.1 IS21 family transposase [Sphaerochaeta sp. S2]MCK9348816.1 IS21 family transposase [Sphaerochaeta sp.]MDD4574665.1 IS21 family transposase [Sphaerochaeta sp.]MDY0244339.1 IS21 family transposase [Sphaerochaeta sp.]
MTNFKEILRLYCGGFSQRSIATSLSCSRDAVALCIKRAKERGLQLPVSEDVTNEDLRKLLHCSQEGVRDPSYLLPDFAHVVKELKKTHVTSGLVWTEYLVECKSLGLKPYSISQFNALVREYSKNNNISLRQDHHPGEVLELDWSGSAILLSDRLTDETIPCHLFVAAFPFSGYFYAEAFENEKMLAWVTGVVHALSFFAGVPLILRPDNLKTAVLKPDKYEPELNTAMIELAQHYKTVVVPARVKAPRDKNVVEGAVGYASRQIIAALRNQKFLSLDEMNQSIWDYMDKLNAADFKKKDGSRLGLFTEQEQPELLPLPSKPFQLFDRITATVAQDYHIEFDHRFYSLPSNLVKSEVSVKATPHTVFIYHKDSLVAEHPRLKFKGQKSTLPEHIPERHRDYLLWSSDHFLSQARRIGPATEQMISNVLASREYEVQSYRSCVGILRIANKYTAECLEAACKEGLESGIHSYKAVNAIAKTLKDAIVPVEGMHPREDLEEQDLGDLYCAHDAGGSR